jgi:L-ascorbate metabolism protein UlaG (beta-lactamase superfamily)
MRLTKYTHACVRLDGDGQALVIDPGVFSEREACDGVSAILVTHEHPDHVNLELLPAVVEQNPMVRIYAGAAVTDQLGTLGEAVVTVSVGDVFTAAGHTVRAVGGRHAEVYDGLPGIANIGYIVDGEVYHPGDALFVPDESVPTLLLPASGPWLKTAEMLDFMRAVAPRRAFPIHDALYNDIGQSLVDGWAKRMGQTDYERIQVGSSVDLG